MKPDDSCLVIRWWLAQLQAMVWKHYKLMYHLFTFYSVVGSGADCFAIQVRVG